MLWHMSIFPSFVKMNNVSLFVCIYHILLIHSSLDDCFHVLSLGCFHVFAIMNSDATWVLSCVFKTMFSIIWDVYLYVRFGASLVAQMVKNLPPCGKSGFNPWVRKILWRRKWQPTPVFLPGKFHGQRSLVGYSSYGGKELDTTE